jgi:hypothetical protein
MTSVDELLSISSEGLSPEPKTLAKIIAAFSLGPELFDMLRRKNGFYAFESALHVFPSTSAVAISLEEWNADTLWRNGYRDLAEGLLFSRRMSSRTSFASLRPVCCALTQKQVQPRS